MMSNDRDAYKSVDAILSKKFPILSKLPILKYVVTTIDRFNDIRQNPELIKLASWR